VTYPVEYHINENAQEHWPKSIQTIKGDVRDRIEKKTYNSLMLAIVRVTSAKRTEMEKFREAGTRE